MISYLIGAVLTFALYFFSFLFGDGKITYKTLMETAFIALFSWVALLFTLFAGLFIAFLTWVDKTKDKREELGKKTLLTADGFKAWWKKTFNKSK